MDAVCARRAGGGGVREPVLDGVCEFVSGLGYGTRVREFSMASTREVVGGRGELVAWFSLCEGERLQLLLYLDDDSCCHHFLELGDPGLFGRLEGLLAGVRGTVYLEPRP